MATKAEKTPYPQKAREKIAASKALDRLIKAMNGEIELTTVQANIGLSLLKKVVPDLKQVEQNITGETTQKHSLDEQSVEQAAKAVYERIKSLGEGDTEADS
jgi:hypothetical protein